MGENSRKRIFPETRKYLPQNASKSGYKMPKGNIELQRKEKGKQEKSTIQF